MAKGSKEGEKPPFTYKTMLAVIAAYEADGHKLGVKHYKLMAQLDGERTESAFQHQFRDVKADARKLIESMPQISAVTPKKRAREDDENDAMGSAKKTSAKKMKTAKKQDEIETAIKSGLTDYDAYDQFDICA